MVVSQPSPPEQFALGYLMLGNAIHLPQIRLNQRTLEISWSLPKGFPGNDPEKYLLGLLKNSPRLNIRYLHEPRLPKDTLLLGFEENLYIAGCEKFEFKISPEIIQLLETAIQNSTGLYQTLNQAVSLASPPLWQTIFTALPQK